MGKRFLLDNAEFIQISRAYPQLNACLHFAADDEHLYIAGYKRAAELLIEHVLNDKAGFDTLIYPILFLYRQCLELQLKSLIKNGSCLLDSPKAAPTTHNLTNLWGDCKKILEKIFDGNDDQRSLKEIGKIIIQLSKIDPSAQAFRYPKDINGNESLSGVSHINIKAVSDIIGAIIDLLDGAELGISEYIQCRVWDEVEGNKRF
jgi:hypothetical protein